MLSSEFLAALVRIAGAAHVRRDPEALDVYGHDALNRGHAPDVVVLPATTDEVAAVVRLCAAHGVPIVPRGAGTGYTGGSVPSHGGVVLSLERLDRILAIDEENLLAVVQPNVVTGVLQEAVERVGLF
ncbi:MAG: FAD-binding oxidoreductase, partial [Acidobacteriota bacterium]|nr:FAD-binding oxidoreductase [Acidobacteriota bacterium]